MILEPVKLVYLDVVLLNGLFRGILWNGHKLAVNLERYQKKRGAINQVAIILILIFAGLQEKLGFTCLLMILVAGTGIRLWASRRASFVN